MRGSVILADKSLEVLSDLVNQVRSRRYDRATLLFQKQVKQASRAVDAALQRAPT